MKQKSAIFTWLATILLVGLVAGFGWVDVSLSASSGGQAIQITGFVAFPIISALILLQGASLLAAGFTPVFVSKSIAAFQVPLVVWHLFVVVTSVAATLESAVAAEITKVTGVVGVESQSQLVELTATNNAWYFYVFALTLNLIALARFTFARVRPLVPKASNADASDSADLWESQG